MNKTRAFVFFILMLTVVLTLRTGAEGYNEKLESELYSELDDFYEKLPEDIKNLLKENGFGSPLDVYDGEHNTKSFITYFTDILFYGIKSVLKSFTAILVILVICALLSLFKSSFESASLSSVISICTGAIISLTVFRICSSLAEATASYMHLICDTMTAFASLMTSVSLMSGSISSAAVASGAVVLSIAFINSILLVFMLPLVKVSLAFSTSSSISEGLDFSGITKTVRSSFTGITLFLMSVFMFVFSAKGLISQGADTLGIKTARFAISSLIPVVGSSINDALRSVSSSLGLIKSGCGIIGIVTVLAIVLPIIINIYLNKLSFTLLSSIAKLLGCERESASISEADSACGFMLMLTSICAVLFIFAITIFINSSVNLV